MTVPVTLAHIHGLAPNARSSYRNAFAAGQAVLDQFEISANPLRLAHFMAQVLHESGELMIQFESLNYSPERLPVVWPTRFRPKGPLDPFPFAHNAERLANEVYGGRMGNVQPGDGFKFRGRGLLQLTGRDSYAEATAVLRRSFDDAPDFTGTPDDVISELWSLKVAAAEWASKGCNELADGDSIIRVTKAINGGLIGLGSRTEWLRRTRHVWN